MGGSESINVRFSNYNFYSISVVTFSQNMEWK